MGSEMCIRDSLFLPAWIALQIFTFAELQRIDEDGRDNSVGLALRFLDKGEMTAVKRPHCGNECDAVSACSKCDESASELPLFTDRLHRGFASGRLA